MPDYAPHLNPEPPPGITVDSTSAEREFTVEARSQTQMILRRFVQHRLAVVSVFILIAVILLAFVGGALWKILWAILPAGVARAV